MKFVLKKERQEADRKRVEAQGISDYQRILTSTLTDKLLQYEQIKVQKRTGLLAQCKSHRDGQWQDGAHTRWTIDEFKYGQCVCNVVNVIIKPTLATLNTLTTF